LLSFLLPFLLFSYSLSSIFEGVCSDCLSHPAEAIYTLQARRQALLHRQKALHQICASCSSQPMHVEIACDSHDCPNLYSRVRNTQELDKLKSIEF
jgi:DNA polymerase zeta